MQEKKSGKPEWFEEWFNELYLQVYNHRDQTEANNFMEKWPIWDVLDRENWSLDIGCGAGRYAILLAERGYKTLAIDLSLTLLKQAQVKCTHLMEPDRPLWIKADMRHIPSTGPFGLIISMFSSFGYFADDDQHDSMIKFLADMLICGGYVIFDLLNPDKVLSQVNHQPDTVKAINDFSVVEKRTIQLNPLRVNKAVQITDKFNKTESFHESVRLFSQEEIVKMFAAVGIHKTVPLWGDYNGNFYNTDSPRMIYFGEKIG